MKTKRVATTALITAALLGAGGCGSTEVSHRSPSPPDDHPRLINFAKHSDSGVVLRKAADVSKLDGTPDGFRQFMAGVIDTNRNWGPPDKDCPTTVSVEKFDSSGYAYGTIGECGGAVLMWAKWHGAWQQVWGGQSIPECADLNKYSIPVSIAGNQCWDGKGAVAYTGR